MPSDESERVNDLNPITVKEKPVNERLPAQGKEKIEPFADNIEIEEVTIVKRE